MLPDKTLLMVGDKVALPASGNQVDMFVSRIDPERNLVYFNKRFSDNPYTLGNHIELTPEGTFLASGTAGSRIWAIEIDTNGNEIRRQTFYQTPTRAVFGATACVKQAPGGRYIATGGPLSYTPSFFYFGSFSSFSSSRQIWGGERSQTCLPPHINDDGSAVIFLGTDRLYLSKFTSDSGLIWQTPFTSRIGSTSLSLNAISYFADSSAIMIGKARFNGPANQDFYLCRIKGVGVPYDPTQPVATKPKHKGLPPLIAYPNPSSGPLTVHTRSRLPLAVFNLSGRQLMQVQPDVSGTTQMDVSALPPGMYVLRQGEAMVKVVRE